MSDVNVSGIPCVAKILSSFGMTFDAFVERKSLLLDIESIYPRLQADILHKAVVQNSLYVIAATGLLHVCHLYRHWRILSPCSLTKNTMFNCFFDQSNNV